MDGWDFTQCDKRQNCHCNDKNSKAATLKWQMCVLLCIFFCVGTTSLRAARRQRHAPSSWGAGPSSSQRRRSGRCTMPSWSCAEPSRSAAQVFRCWLFLVEFKESVSVFILCTWEEKTFDCTEKWDCNWMMINYMRTGCLAWNMSRASAMLHEEKAACFWVAVTSSLTLVSCKFGLSLLATIIGIFWFPVS